jgi:hypothetical protein
MTVEEYFEEWWTLKELPENGFNKTAMLDFAEMYHKQALRIHDVVGRSEQFYCSCSRAKGLDHDEDGTPYCISCQKEVQ